MCLNPILDGVIKAPQELIDRMDALLKMPPPTLEEVTIQMEASARIRKDYDSKRHIKEGRPKDTGSCPIALALKDAG